VAAELYVPPETMIVKKPAIHPVIPGPTIPPVGRFGSHACGLGPASVTKEPRVKSSRTVYVPSPLGVVLAVKVRSNVSTAQSGPHVPESGEPLGNGPYLADAAAAGAAPAIESASTVPSKRASLSERIMMASPHYRIEALKILPAPNACDRRPFRERVSFRRRGSV
jgi:hypothetical protein